VSQTSHAISENFNIIKYSYEFRSDSCCSADSSFSFRIHIFSINNSLKTVFTEICSVNRLHFIHLSLICCTHLILHNIIFRISSFQKSHAFINNRRRKLKNMCNNIQCRMFNDLPIIILICLTVKICESESVSLNQ